MYSLIYIIISMRGNAYNAHYRHLGDVWAVFLRASEFLCVLTCARDTEALGISQPNRYIMAITDFVHYSKNAFA
jgi:hypothetical protein